MIIQIENIKKNIKGKTVIDNVSMKMESGKIYGFVGRNGSGKTMFFKAVSGLIKVDSGRITCDGQELHKDIEILPNLGISLENAGLYPELTGFDNLKLLAGINKKIDKDEIGRYIELVGLDPKDRRAFRKYSLGMKQRLIIAQALMENPDVIIMDEPTNALDEDGIKMVRQLLLEEKAKGKLIMVASHNKEDISCLADEIFVVNEGRISREGNDEV